MKDERDLHEEAWTRRKQELRHTLCGDETLDETKIVLDEKARLLRLVLLDCLQLRQEDVEQYQRKLRFDAKKKPGSKIAIARPTFYRAIAPVLNLGKVLKKQETFTPEEALSSIERCRNLVLATVGVEDIEFGTMFERECAVITDNSGYRFYGVPSANASLAAISALASYGLAAVEHKLKKTIKAQKAIKAADYEEFQVKLKHTLFVLGKRHADESVREDVFGGVSRSMTLDRKKFDELYDKALKSKGSREPDPVDEDDEIPV